MNLWHVLALTCSSGRCMTATCSKRTPSSQIASRSMPGCARTRPARMCARRGASMGGLPTWVATVPRGSPAPVACLQQLSPFAVQRQAARTHPLHSASNLRGSVQAALCTASWHLSAQHLKTKPQTLNSKPKFFACLVESVPACVFWGSRPCRLPGQAHGYVPG
jgi:hypothetical protein